MNPHAYLDMAETESRHWWFAGRRTIVKSLISRLDLPAQASILDVGCGTGGNLEMLSVFGRVTGLEVNEVARRIARQNTNGRFDIQAGSCPANIPSAGRKFDLICMLDVLEHIEEDVASLIKLKDLLTDGGRIVVTVPAYRWLWSRHDEFLHHKRRYTAAELRSKAAAAGLVAEQLSYFNTLLFPLAAIVRIKDRLLNRREASGTVIPPAPVNALFQRVFSAERFLLHRMPLPFGVSLFAILRPKQPSCTHG